MKRYFLELCALVLGGTLIISCGTAPRPTPAPTLAPVVITVVITATPPAALPTLEPTTIAPTTSVTSTVTANATLTQAALRTTPGAATATLQRVAAATNTRRPNTATPTKGATAGPTGIPIAIKYSQAVELRGPLYEGPDSGQQRDVRTFGSDTLVFEWKSNGSLGDGECFVIRVDTKSRADNSVGGDSFLYCDKQAIQVGSGQIAKFTLNKPNFTPGPTYGGITPPGGGEVEVYWNVTIAKDEGPSNTGKFYYWLDGSRHNITFLSPASKTFMFLLRSAPSS